MNKKKQAEYGRLGGLIGGKKTGPTKRRDIDYAALARASWQKRRNTKAIVK